MDRGVVFLFLLVAIPATAAFEVTTLAFDEGYMPLFGDGNLVRSEDGRSVRLLLDTYSGSGFISSAMYRHGLFSAAIKLPAAYTAGVVVAFYLSNGDVFEKTHDELDFEFLGNIHGKKWRVQTNVYGNGSTYCGREERYHLPFDPTADFHRYSILWTPRNIIFYVDDTPIREVLRSAAMGDHYPAKPMSLYATIWDASSWATSGGQYKVDYAYAPFVAAYTDLALLGCRSTDSLQQTASGPDDDCSLVDDDDCGSASSSEEEDCAAANAELDASGLAVITPERRRLMQAFRERYMTYSFCHDKWRYPTRAFPDCSMVASERERFEQNGHAKPPKPVKPAINVRSRKRVKRRSRSPAGSRAQAAY